MANYRDPLDDLPLIDPGKGRVRQERIPTQNFKSAVARSANLIGRVSGRSGGRSARGGHPNRGSQAAAVRRPGLASRRVVVKARYVTQDDADGIIAAKLHVKYIERDGVNREGGPGELYTEKGRGVDAESFLDRSENDPHQFRFMVSPEDASEIDLREFTQELMGQVEQDLGRDLDWVAADHHNTDNPHIHIVIRGRDRQGKEVRLDRDYISHGFRNRAREIATRELGPRLDYEIDRGLQKEVTQERWTSLDYQIEKVSHEKLFDGSARQAVELGEPGSVVSVKFDRFIVGRLNYLQSLGLAQPLGPRRYALDDDYRATLRSLGERGDIIKTMHRALHGEASQYRIHDADLDATKISGRLTKKGLHDELNDRYYAVVESPDGHAHYVKLPKHTDFDGLRVGSIVSVESLSDPWLKAADGVIADHAARHCGIYRADEHANALAADKKFAERNIDPVDYARAHERRAKRLLRFALLQPSNNGFIVPADLEGKLQSLDEEKPNPRTTRLSIKDARSLKKQIESRGPAWIDGLNVDRMGTTGFGAELREARRARNMYLQETLELDPTAKDLKQRLARVERLDVAAARAAETGKQEKPLAPGVASRGRLVAKLEGVSGAQYGVIETEKEFSLVPWRDRLQKRMGRQLSFGMDRSGTPFVRSFTQRLSR